MKKIFYTGIVVKLLSYIIISGVLMSCSHEVPKIGFLLPNLVQKRYVKERDMFMKNIKELGGLVNVLSADNDDNLQLKQATEILNQGIDVLVLCSVNANTSAAIVRAAHEKSVPVIAYDRLIRNCDLDYFLSFDNEKVGELMADYVTKLKPSGKYILMGGDKSDQNAIWVKGGQLKTIFPLVKAGKINIVYDLFIEDWSGENAKHEIRMYLDLSADVPDVILSSNDGMATSVIELLTEYNLNKLVLVTGQDADIEACRNIVRGNQIMTVYKSLKELAYAAAELAIKIAKKEKISNECTLINNGKIDVSSILLVPKVVDKDNIKSIIVADGFFTEEEINK